MDYTKEIEIMQHNLVYIRKTVNISGSRLGQLIGLTKQSISNIEHGRNTLTVPVYLAIRYVLDNDICPSCDEDERNMIKRLLSQKVECSTYLKSLSFEEES